MGRADHVGGTRPADALRALHAQACDLLACAWEELQILRTPEGLVELRLLRHQAQAVPVHATRVGSADEILAWASVAGAAARNDDEPR